MLTQIKIPARVNAFQFLEAEWKFKLDVAGGLRIVSEFEMVVIAIFLFRKSE